MKMNKTKTLFLALCAIALTGCGEQPQTQEQYDADIASRITAFTYKGHRYFMYKEAPVGSYRGYAGITHDPDCSCHNKQLNNK